MSEPTWDEVNSAISEHGAVPLSVIAKMMGKNTMNMLNEIRRIERKLAKLYPQLRHAI